MTAVSMRLLMSQRSMSQSCHLQFVPFMFTLNDAEIADSR
jgi:hypothetical protein